VSTPYKSFLRFSTKSIEYSLGWMVGPGQVSFQATPATKWIAALEVYGSK
jgi:hypothetical protein